MPISKSRQLTRTFAKLFDGSLAPFLDAGVDPVSLEMAQYFWYLDSSRAEKELGWQHRDATTTLADTIADLYQRGVVIGTPRAAS